MVSGAGRDGSKVNGMEVNVYLDETENKVHMHARQTGLSVFISGRLQLIEASLQSLAVAHVAVAFFRLLDSFIYLTKKNHYSLKGLEKYVSSILSLI